MNDPIWHNLTVTRNQKEKQNGHKSILIWFTGLSGSGKSTIAHAVEEKLHNLGCKTVVLDGDNIRYGLSKDLSFSDEDRHENIRRIGEVAKLFVETGIIAMTAFISPFRKVRAQVRNLMSLEDFIEIYVSCPINVCEQRDKKGLYRRARKGEVSYFTGISSPYEIPENPDLTIHTDQQSLEETVNTVFEFLKNRGVLTKIEN
jgi:adenylylsulfate kinase